VTGSTGRACGCHRGLRLHFLTRHHIDAHVPRRESLSQDPPPQRGRIAVHLQDKPLKGGGDTVPLNLRMCSGMMAMQVKLLHAADRFCVTTAYTCLLLCGCWTAVLGSTLGIRAGAVGVAWGRGGVSGQSECYRSWCAGIHDISRAQRRRHMHTCRRHMTGIGCASDHAELDIMTGCRGTSNSRMPRCCCCCCGCFCMEPHAGRCDRLERLHNSSVALFNGVWSGLIR